MIRDEIKSLVEKIITKRYPVFNGRQKYSTEVLVEVPSDSVHGDYSSNVALSLAKRLNKKSVDVANEIVGGISSKVLENFGIKNVKVAGPGFINFYLSKDFFIESIKKIAKDKNVGKDDSLKSKKIIIEYTDPNPFKEFHIGHLMSNAIGESLSRIFEFQGANVKRANYQGDVGLHVAKAVWAKSKNPTLEWPQAYVQGSMMSTQPSVIKEIEIFNKKIYERSDKVINKLYDEGKKDSLKHFEGIYKILGTQFDYYFFESEVAGMGKSVVEKNLGKVFEKGEKGAVVFKGENVGLHTRVFLNSEGLPTYEAKELGLAKVKYDTYKYDTSVIVTGNEINEYFKVLLAAMSQIFPELAKKTFHVGHGMMRLPEGKMSSRTGQVITANFLLSEIEKLVLDKLETREMSELEKEDIAKKVAVGALKYSILKQGIGSDIIYDFEKSISFKGDSGPYLQYAYVRALSVLKKAKKERVAANAKKIPGEVGVLEKMLCRFKGAVQKAGKEYEPHYISLYLTELASSFNHYYAENKIVDSNDQLSPYRVVLVQAFSHVMKNGLWLLGIQAPEKM